MKGHEGVPQMKVMKVPQMKGREGASNEES